jgi:hypothetical protein
VASLRTAIAEPETTRSMQEFLSVEVLGQVLQALPYPEAEANRRLGLVASQLGGLMMGRYILKLPALVDLSVEELVAAVAPTLQRYIDGPGRGARPRLNPCRARPNAGGQRGLKAFTIG